MSLKPDHAASVEFLRAFHPAGPWVLTFIDVERRGIRTDTFGPGDIPRLERALHEHSDRNIYFHVNPTLRPMTKKAEREDIKELAYLHIDLDPRPGEDPEEERARAVRLLNSYDPPPTFVVDSGGGVQGFWQLAEPFAVNGDLTLAEEAKRWNQQLEVELGADNCHDISRIMRLPGTVNWPDAKKRKKGRHARLATLLEASLQRVYPLGRFRAAPKVQGTATEALGFSGDHTVKISGNIPRLASVDELPESVPGWCKVLIVQGEDPDDPHKYPSRSEMLFAVVCELTRHGVSPETVYSVITDPDFLISKSVTDKKNWEKYATRQIERAQEEAIDPQLRQLNELHAVVEDIGGKCRVISEVQDQAMGRPRLSFQSFEDFRNRYMNRRVELGEDSKGNPIRVPLGKWWLEHQRRRQYTTVVFAPGRETPGAYNLWKGFACEARPGDCSLFLTHVKENICGGNQEYYDYLIGWLARAVQHPDSPGETAVVLRGPQGTGKSMFAKTFGNLFGRHFLQVSDPKHLVGSFNAHLRDCVVLFGDEAFYAGDKKHESVLKTLVTEEHLAVEAKGVDMVASPNFVHLIMASNSDFVVPAGLHERRYCVLDVRDAQQQNSAYFQAIRDQMKNGGQEALLHFLLNYDLTGFNVRALPRTEALREQQMFNMTPEEEWWFHKLDEGRLLEKHEGYVDAVAKADLIEDYVETMKNHYNFHRKASRTTLKAFLEKVCPKGFPLQRQGLYKVRVPDQNGYEVEKVLRPYEFVFPSLQLLREAWVKRTKSEVNWTPENRQEPLPAPVSEVPDPF